MIVLMASGNASIVSWNFFDSTRTITATIAAELGEVVSGSAHYRILFLIGVLLFVVTFLDEHDGGHCIEPAQGKDRREKMTATTAQPDEFTGGKGRRFRAAGIDWASLIGTGATGFATVLVLAILAIILGNIVINGWPYLSWRLISTGTATDMFDVNKAGILPMIFGTTARVILMTVFVLPMGVLTAIYLTEYARVHSPFTRIIRGAVNNLAGVPSIVFGLFGAGFFVRFIGGGMDSALYRTGVDGLGTAGFVVGFRDSRGDDPAGGHCSDGRIVAGNSAGIARGEPGARRNEA